MCNNPIRSDIVSLYSDAMRLKMGKMITPRMAIIHPTNHCNQNCAGCEYASTRACNKVAVLSKVSLYGLIDGLADMGVFSVLFSGGGEPTLHPHFEDVLDKAHARGLSVGIFTNGTALETELIKAVLRNANFIRISMDAASPDMYEKVRGVTEMYFNSVLRAVENLLVWRSGYQTNTEIGLKFLIRPMNVFQVFDFASIASAMGVDSVQFAPLRNGPEEPTVKQLVLASEQISRAREKFPKLKIIAKLNPKITATTPCWCSPIKAVISAEGDVHVCNYFNHRRGTHTFANIGQGLFRDLWHDNNHWVALRMIQHAECCLYDCRFHSLNAQLDELVANHRNDFDFV